MQAYGQYVALCMFAKSSADGLNIQVEDKEGHDEVVLTRQFGNETLVFPLLFTYFA